MNEWPKADDCGSSACEAGPTALATAPNVSRKMTILEVPDMCWPTEFSMVEKELRHVPGVQEVAPDFMRETIRVEHEATADTVLTGRRDGPLHC